MAKSKENPEEEKVTFLGKDIDPELQKRVESYMEEPEEKADVTTEAPAAKSINVTMVDNEVVEEPASAPLLPTSELPDLAKKSEKKISKINVIEHQEPEVVAEPEEVTKDEQKTEEAEEANTEDQASEETNVEAELDEASDLSEINDELKQEDQPADEVGLDKVEEELDEKINELAAHEPDLKAEPVEEPKPEVEEPLPAKDELGLETAQTSRAVEDIIATEADEILAAEDRKKVPISRVKPSQKEKRKGLGAFFSAWFKTPKYRNLTLLLILSAVGIVAAVPSSRYYALNNAGVRASLSTKVIDDKTSQPLKNVEVVVGDSSAKTDRDGNVKLSNLKLGPQKIVVRKPAFAEVTRAVTIGWGSNPQQETRLTSIGMQLTFSVADFLSDKAIGAEAISGEASARANEKGEIVLTVPTSDKDSIDIQILADNYRTESLTIATTKKEVTTLKMVPARKQAFVSKRSGKFDLYKIDVDGKNEKLILAGTGLEKEDSIAVVPHPKKNVVALVSTRDNVRNQDGYLLNTLTLVDLDTNETSKLGQSERIQVVDWIGNRLVYVKIAQGQSAASPQRHRLVSYDIESNTEKELASSNYFNDVLSARGAIYYAPSVYKVNGSVGLFKINADGTSKKTIYEKEVWNLFRTSYEKVSASSGQDWFELNLDSGGFTKANGAPPVMKSRVYVDGLNAGSSLWVDERDGKGVLVVYDFESKQDKTLHAQGGLKNPIHWLDSDHAVYRVADGSETADYVISLSGGEPKKIRDVTNTAGLDRWYYY